MTAAEFWEQRVENVLSRLDEIMDAAYFVPLSIGDALALRFRAPTLSGLTLEEVTSVFNLIDGLNPDPGPDGSPDLARAAGDFFEKLRQAFPHIHDKWASADHDVVLDPIGAFNTVMVRAEDLIGDWFSSGPDSADLFARAREIRDLETPRIMESVDPLTHTTDRDLRRRLRGDVLGAYPAWARPGLYLDAWSEFVRAVLDLDPLPATLSRWPY